MSIPTPIRVAAAQAALNQYLDDAGITNPLDRYTALQRQIAMTWQLPQNVGQGEYRPSEIATGEVQP